MNISGLSCASGGERRALGLCCPEQRVGSAPHTTCFNQHLDRFSCVRVLVDRGKVSSGSHPSPSLTASEKLFHLLLSCANLGATSANQRVPSKSVLLFDSRQPEGGRARFFTSNYTGGRNRAHALKVKVHLGKEDQHPALDVQPGGLICSSLYDRGIMEKKGAVHLKRVFCR